MPYRSTKQRAKFHAMAERGEISKKTVAEWDSATGSRKLPKYVKGSKSNPEGMLGRGMRGAKR